VFSTGQSSIFIPSSIYVDFIKTLRNFVKFSDFDGFLSTNCKSKITAPIISIRIGLKYFQIPPEHYVVEVRDGRCIFPFQESSFDYWVLGDVFLAPYYTIFDDEESQIGLVPHINSSAKIIDSATEPSDYINPLTRKQNEQKSLNTQNLLVFIISCLAILSMIIAYIVNYIGYSWETCCNFITLNSKRKEVKEEEDFISFLII